MLADPTLGQLAGMQGDRNAGEITGITGAIVIVGVVIYLNPEFTGYMLKAYLEIISHKIMPAPVEPPPIIQHWEPTKPPPTGSGFPGSEPPPSELQGKESPPSELLRISTVRNPQTLQFRR
jgi:hypothetical protein